MAFDFGGILKFLQVRIERSRLQARLALLNLLHTALVKLAPPSQREELAAEWETHSQKTGEQWKSLHRQALFTNVGLALSHWAAMEDSLVGIACLLLRTQKVKRSA